MIDIHTHILPNIDDGAVNFDMAISMLDILKNDNVTDIVLTPHFYSNMESLNDFVKKRDKQYDNFTNRYQGNIKLHLGSEVYITEYLFKYNDLSDVCIDKKKYMLIELPFETTISDMSYKIIEMLIYNHHITPIIAHIERYPFVKYDNYNRFIDSLISIGCLIQVNCDSLLTSHSRKLVLSLIKDNKVNFIASDAHNLKLRPPNYGKALTVVESKLGIQYLDKLKNYESIISS